MYYIQKNPIASGKRAVDQRKQSKLESLCYIAPIVLSGFGYKQFCIAIPMPISNIFSQYIDKNEDIISKEREEIPIHRLLQRDFLILLLFSL